MHTRDVRGFRAVVWLWLVVSLAGCLATTSPSPQLPPATSPSPQPSAGLAHLEPLGGLSFDYPAQWLVSYPTDVSMMDRALVTVASKPLLPPCGSCQRFSTPEGGVVIEFRVGSGPLPPAWTPDPSLWSLRVGGEPAHREDWGPQNATAAQEGHTWTVWLGGPRQLGIYASLRGPDLPALEAAMNQVVASVRIDLAQIPQN